MRRHPLDPLSFVLGALFVVVGASFLPGTRSAADLSPAWFWALPLLGLSVFMVLTGLRRALARPEDPARADREHHGPPLSEAAGEGEPRDPRPPH